MRRRRSKTATWVAGRSEVDLGRPAPESRIIVPVSARAKSTPVTPSSARAASARWRRRAASPLSPGPTVPTASPAAASAGRRSSPSIAASHATTSRADFSRAMASTAAGTSATVLTRWNTPATCSNSCRKRSRASGQRSAICRRTASAASAGRGGRVAVCASKRPGVLATSARIRPRKSARVAITPGPSSARGRSARRWAAGRGWPSISRRRAAGSAASRSARTASAPGARSGPTA